MNITKITIPMSDAVKIINDGMYKAIPEKFANYTVEEYKIANSVFETTLDHINGLLKLIQDYQ